MSNSYINYSLLLSTSFLFSLRDQLKYCIYCVLFVGTQFGIINVSEIEDKVTIYAVV